MITSKEKSKNPPRPLFSATEIRILSRNAVDILRLHELFVEELRSEMAPFGFHLVLDDYDVVKGPNVPPGGIDVAIRAVAAKFTTEVGSFYTA
jgi:hypothetical protein